MEEENNICNKRASSAETIIVLPYTFVSVCSHPELLVEVQSMSSQQNFVFFGSFTLFLQHCSHFHSSISDIQFLYVVYRK